MRAAAESLAVAVKLEAAGHTRADLPTPFAIALQQP